MMLSIRILVASVAMLVVTAQQAPAATILYTSGHVIDTVAAGLGGVTLAAGNPTSGFFPDTPSLTAALGGGFGAYDALVIGEANGIIDAAGKTAILNYANSGGHVVVLGAHGAEVSFLNSTFGYSVTQHAAPSADHAPISRVAGAGPATLLALNGSWFMDNAPGTVTYVRDAGGTAAFVDSIGAGTLSWLAWDFCECSEPDDLQADWFSLLGTGAIENPVPEPSSVALFAIGAVGMMGYGWRRKKKIAA